MERKEIIQDRGLAVMFLIVCGSEVLLEARPNNKKGFANQLIIPAGKNKPGESYGEAARREIFEETGWKVDRLTLLGKPFQAITTNAPQYLMQAYLVEVIDKSVIRNMEPEKGAHVWVGFEEALGDMIWAHSLLVLERVKNLLQKS